MNNVNLMGRLTRDPEVRTLENGQTVARFSIAVDRQMSKEKKAEAEAKGQPTADFPNIVVWGKMAESVAKFTAKGLRVLVTGRIQTGSYDDKDGKRVYTTDVVASNIQFIDWKDNGQAQQQNQPPQRPQPQPQPQPQNQAQEDFAPDFSGYDQGDLPFSW